MAVKLGSPNVNDGCFLGYNATILAYVLAFRAAIPSWQSQALLSALALALSLLIVLLLGDRSWLPWRLIRNFYPLGFLLFLYDQTGMINHAIVPGFLDPAFQRAEAAVFGCQPAVVLAQRFPQPWLVEYMHFAYASYYGMFTGMGLFLYFRRGQAAFAEYMFTLCNTFYACYLIFVLLPVKGAASFGMSALPIAGPFTRLMAGIYGNFEIEGAAFPSSHVAIAVVVLFYAFLYARRAAWAMAPLTLSLAVATVYCRYHYAVDALAGVATAAVLIPFWRRINPALRRKPMESTAKGAP